MNARGRPARRRTQVLAFVRDAKEATGRAPSYGEICEGLGIRTRQEVTRMIAGLEAQGLLHRRDARGKVRRIVVA